MRTAWMVLLSIGTAALLGVIVQLSNGPDANAHELARPQPIELLPPTGPLSVGRTSFYWVDAAREPQAAEPKEKRECVAQIWYPAELSPDNGPAAYIPGFEKILAAVGEPKIREEAGGAFDALSTARTHVVEDAPVRDDSGKYPVLMLVHGLRFHALGYSMLAEELASHGYVVVGVDLTPIAFATLLSDGRVSRFPEALWTQRRTREETSAFEREIVNACAADLRFALDRLAMLDSGQTPSRFQSQLDMERVGIIGHSFGGRIAARVCQLDSRLKAVAILDSFGRVMTVERNADGSTLARPAIVQYARRVPKSGVARLLALAQNGGKDLEEELAHVRKEFCESVRAASYEVTFSTRGIIHESFSDMPLLDGEQSGDARKEHERTMQLIRDYTRAFFDRHVCSRPAPLLDQRPDASAEVTFARHTFRAK